MLEWTNQLLILFLMLSTCQSKMNGCGFPGSPKHAKIRTTDDQFKEGTIVTFECDPGYQLLGRSTSRCVNSEWASPGMPFCAREITYLKPTGMTSNNHTALFAVDDKRSTCSRSDKGFSHTWWVDLIEQTAVHIVEIHFGMEIDNLKIDIHVEDFKAKQNVSCVNRDISTIDSQAVRYFKCEPHSNGRKVHISVSSKEQFILELCEVNVFSQSLLSPHDVCGKTSTGIESFERKCFETAPTQTTFHHAYKACLSLGGTLWRDGNYDFIHWMMQVHNLSGIWVGSETYERNATECNFLSKHSNDTSPIHNPLRKCDEKHSAICVRSPFSCGRPSLPKHASTWMTSRVLLTGVSSQELSCEEGFFRSGPQSSKCLGDGTLDQTQPSLCLKSACGEPPSVPNGYPVLRPSPRIMCNNENYILHGDPTLECNTDIQQWGAPRCVCIKLPTGFHYKEKNIQTRLLQGVELFPIVSRSGILVLLISLLILAGIWMIFLFNMVHFYQVLRPKLLQRKRRSMMLESLHDQLSFDTDGGTNSDNNTVQNTDAELSNHDARNITKMNSFSTPRAPQTPELQLNESSICVPKIELSQSVA